MADGGSNTLATLKTAADALGTAQTALSAAIASMQTSGGASSSATEPSPDGTTVSAGSSAIITDRWGNVLGISPAGQVVVNGTVDLLTGNVVSIAAKQGVVWQTNKAGGQWSYQNGKWQQEVAPGGQASAGSGASTGSSGVVSGGTLDASAPAPVSLLGSKVSRVFASDFSSGDVIGRDFFLKRPAWMGPLDPKWIEFHAGDGMHLLGDGAGPGLSLLSVNPDPQDNRKWIGAAFDGAIYSEVEAAFDATQAEPDGVWPGPHWAMSAEHLFPRPGIDPDDEWLEPDAHEMMAGHFGQPAGYYEATLHHWTRNGEKVPQTLQQIAMPGGVPGFNQRHFYGYLIMPATDSTPGWLQWCFDRKPVANVIRFAKGAPYSLAGMHHMPIILGTGMNFRVRFYSAQMWRLTA
jgi:hypothetical protein